MKKLLIICVVVCGMLQSCSDSNYKEVDGRKVEIITSDDDIKYIEFDGHEYVYMHKGYGKTMCHSPKCHCLTKYEK